MPISAPPGYHYEGSRLVRDMPLGKTGWGREAFDRTNAARSGGVEIPTGGNGYSVNRFGEIVEAAPAFNPLLAAAVLSGPFAVGLMGGAGAGAGAGAGSTGALPSSTIPGLHAAVPGAIASQGASAGIASGAAAGGLGLGTSALTLAPGLEAGLNAQKSGGFLSGLYNDLGGWQGIAGLGGQAIGAMGETAAQNRGSQFAGQLDLERILMDRDTDFLRNSIAREAEGRAGSSDAWRKVLAGNYVTNRPQMPSVSPYAAPQRDLSSLQPAASALQAEAMKRLQGGNPIAPVTQRPLSVDPSLLQAGGYERAANVLAPILSILGRR